MILTRFYSIMQLMILSLFSILSAQSNYKDGYIITMGNDTIYGKIDLRGDINNSANCRFLNTSTGEINTYKPYDIYGYRFEEDGRYYVSRRIELSKKRENEVFLEYLIQGVKSLYYYESSDNVAFYFVENEGRLVKVDSPRVSLYDKYTNYHGNIRRYIPILQYLYGDCPDLADKVVKTRYNHEDMIKIAKDYHYAMCTTGEKCVTFVTKSKRAQKARLHFTPYVGLALMDYEKGSYDVTIKPAVRYGVNFLISGINPSGFGFVFDLSFVHSNLKLRNLYVSEEFFDIIDNHRDFIIPNIGLRYTRAFNRFSIFGEVGVGANFTIKNDWLVGVSRKFHPYGSVGTQYYTTKKRKQAVAFKIQYEYNMSDRALFDYNSVGSVLLGYTF